MKLILQVDNPLDDILGGLEAWCEAFNEFAELFFGYLKYIFAFMLIIIGISTLLKLRGYYIRERMKNSGDKLSSMLDKPRLILGTLYITIGFGIMFNWFTLFLLYLLDPLPDRLIFNFIDFYGGIDPTLMNRIMDFSAAIYPHEKTIYYCIALASFGAITDLAVALWYLINRVPFNPKMGISLLIGGVSTGILTGFTTCLPFFL